MAYYYVRNDGDDLNTGLGAVAGEAWKTISKAISHMVSGDTCYVAPGFYNEELVINGTTELIREIRGDVLSTKFSDIASGEIVVSGSPTLHTRAVNDNVLEITNTANRWYIHNITFYPGTVATIVGQGATTNRNTFEGCKFVGKLLNVGADDFLACDFIACTLDTCHLTQFDSSIFNSLVSTGNQIFQACLINLGTYTITGTATVNIKNCTINLFPSRTTGHGIVDEHTGSQALYIQGCEFNGVGKALGFTTNRICLIRGNCVHNLDGFIDKAANPSSCVFKINTYYTCKKCLIASTYSIPSEDTENSNFIRCDSIADGQIILGSTCVQSYGGRLTGTGGSSSITAYRLPYISELSGVFTTSAVQIPGYVNNLVLRGAGNDQGVFIAWIPVQKDYKTTVTFKYKNLYPASSGFIYNVILGTLNYSYKTSFNTTNIISYSITYDSFFTGYVPLIILAKGASSYTSLASSFVSDITWKLEEIL